MTRQRHRRMLQRQRSQRRQFTPATSAELVCALAVAASNAAEGDDTDTRPC